MQNNNPPPPPNIILQGHRRCILGSAKTIVIGLKKYKKNWVFFSLMPEW